VTQGKACYFPDSTSRPAASLETAGLVYLVAGKVVPAFTGPATQCLHYCRQVRGAQDVRSKGQTVFTKTAYPSARMYGTYIPDFVVTVQYWGKACAMLERVSSIAPWILGFVLIRWTKLAQQGRTACISTGCYARLASFSAQALTSSAESLGCRWNLRLGDTRSAPCCLRRCSTKSTALAKRS